MIRFSVKIFMQNCYCGASKPFQLCCGTYHRQFNAPTALALMKSRYSAFCIANVNYLEKTQRGDANIGFNKDTTKSFAQSVKWLGLQIVRAYADRQHENTAYVEFVARFLDDDHLDEIHELSKFEFDPELKQWFYCKGHRPSTKVRIANNAPCPCHSGKKYKNCHGKS